MSSRWQHDRPMSRGAFDARFPDEEACARYFAAKRWPAGFVCPACGVCKGWELETKSFTWECSGCRQARSGPGRSCKLPLRTWFEAIHLLTSHSNGISAEQAQAQLGIASYKTAWLLLQKLRRAMVSPDRGLLEDLVEADETEVPFRSKHDPVGGYGCRTSASCSSSVPSSYLRTGILAACGWSRSRTGPVKTSAALWNGT